MTDYRKTKRRSIIAFGFDKLLQGYGFKQKLVTDSLESLKAYQDLSTPRQLKYERRVFGNADCFWVKKPSEGQRVLVYLAGGAFIIGPTKLHWNFCDQMASSLDVGVVLLRYPLAPKYQFPKGLHAITSCIKAMQESGELGKSWFLAGDSAGGSLAVSTCYQLSEMNAVLPEKLILLFPALDLSGKIDSPADEQLNQSDHILSEAFNQRVKSLYFPTEEATHPLISPIYGKLDLLPPTLIIQGNHDLLAKGNREFVHKMEALGKQIVYEEYEGMFHGFVLLSLLPEAKQAMGSIQSFLVS